MKNMMNYALLISGVSGVAASATLAQDYSNTLGTPGFGGSYVAAFAAYDDGTGESLYATGSFTTNGVSGGSQIARWDGSAWNEVGGGFQANYSNVITVFQGDLIAGGYFSSAGNVAGTEKLARWDGTAWHSMDAQSSSFLNSIWDLAVYDDGTGEQLFVAGNYVDLNGNPALDHIASWDGTSYSAVGGTIGGAVPLIVLDLHVADLGAGNLLYAGGRFLTIGGGAALNVASWDGSAWSALGDGLSRSSGTAQIIHMTAWDDGSGMALYAGGTFNRSGAAVISQNVAKWDGTQWTSMGDGFGSTVQELVVFDDGTGEALYALGNFTDSGPTPVNHIAKWNGTKWEAVGDGVDGNAFGAFVYDAGEGPALHIGGSFTTASGLASNKVVSILADTTVMCPADLNYDGKLNFFDISTFLNAFTNMNPIADFTGDGLYNFFDVSAFLSAFSAGCP